MSSSQPRADTDALTGATWSRGIRLRIYDHVFSDLHHEVGGFLLGQRSPDGRLKITGEVPAYSADERTASVTFTQQDWADVHAAIDDRAQDEQIVGWYHSHPGFGIFLSEFDLFIHRNFFSNPGQVAYVVDPHAGREGMFGWRDGDVALLAEGETQRAAERPNFESSSPSSAKRWQPKHYMPAVAVGLVVGALAAWGLVGRDDKSTTTVTTRTVNPRNGQPATPTIRPTKPSPSPGLSPTQPSQSGLKAPRGSADGSNTPNSGATQK